MQKQFIITPKTESVTLSLRLDGDTNAIIEEFAAKSGRSRNELINLALRFAFSEATFSKSAIYLSSEEYTESSED